ncbi:MAG: NADH-quinone oxidoreductase subunit NuoB [Fibrobacteraceae bacterium]|nr:NADH-quinone oxidoreductase subunit NuoB [Fibrobacteraceae bacterium]
MGIMPFIPKILDPVPGGKTIVNMVDYVVNWARANSLWPLTYGTSCCAIEMMSSSMARYDIARFGSEVFRDSPRQADLFIIAGTITERMAPAVQMLWEQIPGPKYSIAMGACTISGGPFRYDNYAVVRGAEQVIPVDVFIPGCPPRPEALFHGLLKLREKIMKESSRNVWKEGALSESEERNRYKEAALAWAELEKIKDEEMALAREQFKTNPPENYVPYKAVRVQKETFPEIERVNIQTQGKSVEELFKIAETYVSDIKIFDESSDILDIVVSKEKYFHLANSLKNDENVKLDYLIDVTAVDWNDHFDVIAQLMSTKFGHKVFLRVELSKKEISDETKATSILASLDSLTPLYPAADFKEREVYDMFGIYFENHPDMRRLFLDEDFKGYPLRKDFTHPHIIPKPV